VVRLVVHRHEKLGGQHDIVAASGEGPADNAFGLAGGVDVGRVDEIYASIQSPVDNVDQVGYVSVSPGPEYHGAQAQWADRDTGPAEDSVLHGRSNFPKSKWSNEFTGVAQHRATPGGLITA
jgi:hypothetical protein